MAEIRRLREWGVLNCVYDFKSYKLTDCELVQTFRRA